MLTATRMMIFGLGSICLSITGMVSAEEEHFGTVDAIYHEEAAVVIGDQYMKMNLNMKLFDSDGNLGSRYDLKLGQKALCIVDFLVEPARVSEIHLKDDSYQPPGDDDDE